MKREFEELLRKGLRFLENNVSNQERLSLLKDAHEGDHMIGSLASSVGLGTASLDELDHEMETLFRPEFEKIYKEELLPKWFEAYKTINGYESFALRAKAKQIWQERNKK